MVKNSCKLVDEQLIKASIRIPRYSASGTAISGPLVQTNLAQRVHDEVRRRTNIFFEKAGEFFHWGFCALKRGLGSEFFRHYWKHRNIVLNFISRSHNGHQVRT